MGEGCPGRIDRLLGSGVAAATVGSIYVVAAAAAYIVDPAEGNGPKKKQNKGQEHGSEQPGSSYSFTMSGELNLRSNSSAADVIAEFNRVYVPQIEAAFSRFHKTAQESLLMLVTRTIAELAC